MIAAVDTGPAVEPPRFLVTIQEADFDIAELQSWLLAGAAAEGATATFTGYVRAEKGADPIRAMHLEHYPGMTEHCIGTIVGQALRRWPVNAVRVVHRVGHLQLGEQIVWVGVSAPHRAAAFSACEFIMDYLKAEAPLWKKVISKGGEHWVEAKSSDSTRANRWQDDASQ
jgi:molybdopterin synthase catalytic subunit